MAKRHKRRYFRRKLMNEGFEAFIKEVIRTRNWAKILELVNLTLGIIILCATIGGAWTGYYIGKTIKERIVTNTLFYQIRDVLVPLKLEDNKASRLCENYENLSETKRRKVDLSIKEIQKEREKLIDRLTVVSTGIESRFGDGAFSELMKFLEWNRSLPNNLCLSKNLMTPEELDNWQNYILPLLEKALH